MPPAPKRRTAMSMRNILNPTQEGSDLQRPRSTTFRQNQPSQQDSGSGIPAHDPGDDSKPNAQSAVTREDDINIKGQVERRPFADRSQTYRANDATSNTSNAMQNDQTSEISGPGVHAQTSTLDVPRTPERGSMLAKSFRRRESTGSEPMKMSDDESSDENMLSDHSADDEPSQRSPWSSQGQQYSSQSTVQSNRHEDIEEHHGSSMETVLQSSQGLSRLTMQSGSPSSNPEPPNGTPLSQKRRRALANLEPETEGASHRKIIKLSHPQPTVISDSDEEDKPNQPPSTKLTPQPANPPTTPPSLSLSPSKSHIYLRRQSLSPTRPPPRLLPPFPRPARFHLPPTPSAPSPETSLATFNIFSALLTHPDLVLEFSKHLTIPSLTSLYSISRAYHNLANTHFTALITAHAKLHLPEAHATYPFRAYRHLCRRDPAGRLLLFSAAAPTKTGKDAQPNEDDEDKENEKPFRDEDHKIDIPAPPHLTANDTRVRFVPSLRYLLMLRHRTSTTLSILTSLSLESHRLPRRASLILHKLWFLLDISDNGRRIALLHDPTLWPNKDLFLLVMFIVKLDMRLTDPVTGTGEIGFRRLLLGQRGLGVLERVLRRVEGRNQLELARMIVKFDGGALLEGFVGGEGATVFGVPWAEVGKGCLEGWGEGVWRGVRGKFLPVDELVMREALRRRLVLQSCYVDMMLYGYMDKKVGWTDTRTVPEGGRAWAVEERETERGLEREWADLMEVKGRWGLGEGEGVVEQEAEVDELRRREMGLFLGETDVEDEQEEDVGGEELDFGEEGMDTV